MTSSPAHVLALLAALAASGCRSREVPPTRELPGVRVKQARLQARYALDAVEVHLATAGGACPADLTRLVGSGLLRERQLLDPWGSPLRVRCPAGGACVRSAGPDLRDDQGRGDDVEVCSGTPAR